MRQFGYLLVRVMVLFVLTVNHLLDRPTIESLLYAVALALWRPYLEPLAGLFDFTPLPGPLLATLLLIVGA